MKAQRGYSIFELLVVIALLSIPVVAGVSTYVVIHFVLKFW